MNGEAPGADEVRALLARVAVFAGLDEAGREALVGRCARFRRLRVADGEALVTEGDEAAELILIRDGQARVVRRGRSGTEHELNRLGPGDCIGELALIDPAPRSATVRACGPVDAVAMPIGELMDLAFERPAFAAGLLGMARLVAARLRTSTDVAVRTLQRQLQEERTRIALGQFTITLIVTYSLYAWVLGTAAQAKQWLGRSELITLPAVIITLSMLAWFKHASGYPASFFGLTLRHAGRHMLEALALTLPLMALTVALKWWLVNHVDAMAGAPLVQMGSPPAPGRPASEFNPWLTLAYVVFVPLQELIYRGSLQGALEHFLTGRWRRWAAILGSNIIFSAAHLYISPGLSVTAFVAGLFWGWLYSRQRGLAGVSLSHVVLGFFAFEVVDLGVLE